MTIRMDETPMDFRITTVPLTDERVEAHLRDKLDQRVRTPSVPGQVMIHRDSRFKRCKRFLTLYRDGKGHFVRVGSRGHDKRYLGASVVTSFKDGSEPIFQFTFAP